MKIIYTSLLYKIVAILIVLIVASSCLDQQVGIESPESRITEFTFRPTLDVSLESKSIGDASRVNQLKVGVFQEDETGLRFIDLHTKLWSQVLEEGVNIELSSDNSYQLLFWLEDSDNSAYYINKDGTVKVNYADYISSGFAKMEELDVFYATTTISSVQTEKQQKIVLTRPVAQLNFADQRKPEMGIHKAKVTLHSFPNSFDPFTGKVNMTDPVDESDDVTFTFVDFPTETFIYNGKEYHYVSCNYILAPTDDIADVECTVELLKNGQTVAHYEFNGNKSIVIEPRKKVNMLDYMVPEPEKWSEWNGKFPTISTLSLDPDNQDCYLIDDAEDIAFLSNREKVAELGEGKTFKLMANIDMGYKPNQSSMKLPARSTFDGNGFTIKGVKMMAGLFGDVATNLTLRNLTVVDAFVTSTTNSHKGIIANTLSGSSSITNVTVANSTVIAMNGAAGGLVGYISRREPKNRSEQLEVMFDNCHVINNSIQSQKSEGHLVGMLCGYDSGETLIFKDNCSVTISPDAESLNSYILEGNEALWIADSDFTKYNAWLGREECYRGQVYFENKRYIAKWDGHTFVTPLLADPLYDDSSEYKVKAGNYRYMIYSPFDLAGARKKTSGPKALYFKTDLDMNGQGKDGVYNVPEEFSQSKCYSEDDNWFRPFSSVKYLDGQNNTIYNLCLNSRAVNDTTYVSAFIRSAQRDTMTTHKNLIMRNCCSVSPVIRKGYGGNDMEPDDMQDLSHGSIFIASTGVEKSTGQSTYSMDNIHIYDSKVFALQHSAILCGILGRGKMSNCSVNNCHIENYNCEDTPELFSKVVNIAGSDIEVYEWFYSYGEIGALIGTLRGESSVTNCHVRNTRVHAYAELDKEAQMRSDGFIGKTAIATAKGMGYYLIPGRPVSTMIGAIRTYKGETITINNSTVDAATKCTQDHSKHNNSYPYIGQAYYIKFQDTMGQVIVDGNQLTLADCNKNTQR